LTFLRHQKEIEITCQDHSINTWILYAYIGAVLNVPTVCGPYPWTQLFAWWFAWCSHSILFF